MKRSTPIFGIFNLNNQWKIPINFIKAMWPHRIKFRANCNERHKIRFLSHWPQAARAVVEPIFENMPGEYVFDVATCGSSYFDWLASGRSDYKIIAWTALNTISPVCCCRPGPRPPCRDLNIYGKNGTHLIRFTTSTIDLQGSLDKTSSSEASWFAPAIAVSQLRQ